MGSEHALDPAVQECTEPRTENLTIGGTIPRRMKRYGRFVLVDLAGSERLKETERTCSESLSESCAINRSLFTLGRVISALSDNSRKRKKGQVIFCTWCFG
jgi:hypothetical protein